jgi:hypothetical protein
MLGRIALAMVCDLAQLSGVITDDAAGKAVLVEFERAGMTMLVACPAQKRPADRARRASRRDDQRGQRWRPSARNRTLPLNHQAGSVFVA